MLSGRPGTWGGLFLLTERETSVMFVLIPHLVQVGPFVH